VVGDVRIEFRVTKPGTISVVAKQSESGLGPFRDADDETIELAKTGTHTAEALFESAKSSHGMVTWVLRVLAFAFVAFGLYLVGQPKVSRADSLPRVGNLLALGGIPFGIVVGLAVSFILSAVMLVTYQPLFSVLLLVAAGGSAAALSFLGARKLDKTAGTSKLPAAAAKAARNIKKRGGKVEVWGDGPDMTTVVTLDGKQFNDDALAELNVFTGMNTLWLTNTAITGTGLARIQVKQLESLYVRGELSPEGLQALGTLTGLKKLDLGDSKLTDQGLGSIKGLSRLEEVALSDTQLTDAGLVHLAGWTSLKSLNLSGGSLTGSGLDSCKGLKNLATLRVQFSKLTDAGMVGLKNLAGLKELAIGFNEINGNGLGYIQNLTQLEELDLENSQVADKGLNFLGKLAKLRKLDLTRTKVTDAGLAYLKVLPALQTLELYRCAITDQGLAHLSSLANLNDLEVDRTNITDAGLPAIARLSNLKVLHLDHTGITDAGLIHLNRLTNLHWLTLHGTKVTEERVEGLRQALPGANVELTGWRGIVDEMEFNSAGA